MTRMVEAWRRRTGPERFETYTRWTLYLLLGTVPFLALGIAATAPAEATLLAFFTYPVAATVQAGVAIAVIRVGITAFRDSAPLPRWAYPTLLVPTAAAAAAALALLPPADEIGWLGRGPALLLVLLVAVFALTPVLGIGPVTVLTLASAVAGALANRPAIDPSLIAPAAFLYALVGVAMAVSFRISIWMLGVVWEQERTRGLHARLAVAEERLRFSRDLHDVMGRALSAVAVKSELAAELARRDRGEAAATEMLEVRELANDSLREVRAVVAGYRQADLTTELAGARSMLRAAGVRTRIIGEDTALPRPVQSALAWVVREGATNVVRHSSADTCTIDLSVADDGERVARLTITNDGVVEPPSSGSGLVGLAERLATLGGSVHTDSTDGRFVLRAQVPVAVADRLENAAPTMESS